ncbi:MAG TPA: glycosyltransferase family 2 protein [Patescibacteria group bacterium]
MQKKNNLPLVSVIVPFYNEEKHIEQCLQTLKKQTYSKVQLIAVDDGSTDSSRKIAKKYVDILLVQKHQGPGVARNKAAKIAKGKILIFADADMYFDKNYIKMLIKPILHKKAVATFTNEEYLANYDNTWVKCSNIDNNVEKEFRNKKLGTSSVARAVEKKFFTKIGGMKPEFGYGDDHLFLDIAYKAISVKKAVCYHYSPETLSEVFEQARWIGRSPSISKRKYNLFRYSIINSIIISLRKTLAGATIKFFIYKAVFDFGIICGILFSKKNNNYAK